MNYIYTYIIRQTNYRAIVKLTRPTAVSIYRVCRGGDRTVWTGRDDYTAHTTCCDVYIIYINVNVYNVIVSIFYTLSPNKTKLQGTLYTSIYLYIAAVLLRARARARERSFLKYIRRACRSFYIILLYSPVRVLGDDDLELGYLCMNIYRRISQENAYNMHIHICDATIPLYWLPF